MSYSDQTWYFGSGGLKYHRCGLLSPDVVCCRQMCIVNTSYAYSSMHIVVVVGNSSDKYSSSTVLSMWPHAVHTVNTAGVYAENCKVLVCF